MRRDLLGKEGNTRRPSRSCVTRYGTRGPGSQANRNAKTNRHGLLAGDDGASHRRLPSSFKRGNRCAGTGVTSWPGPTLPSTYEADNCFQCMALLLTSKKWRLQREGRQSRRRSVEMMCCWPLKKAVAERRKAEPKTQRRNEVELASRKATIKLSAESCRQKSCKPITVSCRSHAKPLRPTMRFPEIFRPLASA